MPTISVINLSTSPLALPGNVYTSVVASGETVSFDVDDLDEFLGLSSVADLITRALIRVETATTDTNWRPTPSYTNALLPTDATVGMVVFNSTSGTLVRWSGAAWVALSLSNPVNIQVGLPAGTAGQLSYNSTTQSLMLYTGAAWDTVFVAPESTIGAPPATAAAIDGGAFYATDLGRLAFYDEVATQWAQVPTTSYATAANIEVARGAVTTAGQFGWASDTNRMAVYTGAAWFNETTVGMYAPGGATAANGVVVYDSTGFANLQAGYGVLRVYNAAYPGGAAWAPVLYVAPSYATGALPVVGDVPVGTVVYDTTKNKLQVSTAAGWETITSAL
jgi:hypothetical protein